MNRFSIILIILSVVFSCQDNSEAQKIIDQSIDAHGGDLYKIATISFDFRDKHYEIFKSPDSFRYVREFTDSKGMVRDLLTNDGFSRTINGEVVELSQKMEGAYTRSVNSVAYFALLPYGLNDPAVYKEYLEETEIEGIPYHLIKVTFAKNGGGEDYDDEFLYWINKENFLVDYLAYSYHTDGGGVRFRKAIKTYEVSGLHLQDYDNYKVEDKNTPVEDVEGLFKNGELELLSQILLENIEVTVGK